MRAVLRSHSVLKCGEDNSLHNCIALAIGVYAIFREGALQSTVFGCQRGIEVDEFAVEMFCKASYAAVHVADGLYRLDFWAPRVSRCRKDSAEDDFDIMLFCHLCHRLYILHYQTIRYISIILCNIVRTSADNHAVGISVDNIPLKSSDHLGCDLAALSAIYEVIILEELGVSAMFRAIPTIEY